MTNSDDSNKYALTSSQSDLAVLTNKHGVQFHIIIFSKLLTEYVVNTLNLCWAAIQLC